MADQERLCPPECEQPKRTAREMLHLSASVVRVVLYFSLGLRNVLLVARQKNRSERLEQTE